MWPTTALLNLTDCTISGNSAGAGAGDYGGGLFNGGNATLTDTIVAGNEQDMTPSDIGGTVTGSYNLIGSGGSGGLVDGTSGNIVGAANPGLGILGENGGLTPTIPLLFGSPAIGAGTPILGITTDQRGVFRGSYVDIGAYQLNVLAVESTAGNIDTRPGSLTLAGAVSLGYQFGANGFTITFDPTVFAAPQTITLTSGQLELSNNITISGPAAGVTISGGGQNRVFEIDYGVTASLSGLAITGGSSSGNGGGVANNNGTLTLTDCNVTGNTAGGSGGGIYESGGTLTLTDSTIVGNQATQYGGGLADLGAGTGAAGTVTVTGGVVEDNFAGWAGGGVANFGQMTLTDVQISGNTAASQGGGLANLAIEIVGQIGDLTLKSCTVSGNTVLSAKLVYLPHSRADGGGGGIFGQASAALALSNCTVSGNTAAGPGGGLYVFQGTATFVTACTISGNTAASGGGLDDVPLSGASGPTTLTNTIVAQNSGGDIGGAITGSNNLIAGNPDLAPLGNFGGPALTMPPLTRQPGLGRGTDRRLPGYDQANYHRRTRAAARLAQARHRRLPEPRFHPHRGQRQHAASRSTGHTLRPAPGAHHHGQQPCRARGRRRHHLERSVNQCIRRSLEHNIHHRAGRRGPGHGNGRQHTRQFCRHGRGQGRLGPGILRIDKHAAARHHRDTPGLAQPAQFGRRFHRRHLHQADQYQ